ncbi:MAG: class I SAM-dependent methyltransferase [Planctomycetaceae bacterium]|nr:class I SAM-dependent methyltransferase [Planctomycetaceae bacterium]
MEDKDDNSWKAALTRGKEQHGNLEVNLRFLEETGLLKSGDEILEVGCGIGTVVDWLRKKGCNAIGSDIAPTAVEYGRQKYPGITLTVESAEQLNYADGQFDRVLSFDVLEHLFHVDQHLDEVYRVLKANGHYLFQTPNKISNAIFETLRSRSLNWRIYHPSLHTARQLRKRLERHGFQVRFLKMDPVSPFFLNKLPKWKWLRRLVKAIPFERLPLCMQTNLYVIARKSAA